MWSSVCWDPSQANREVLLRRWPLTGQSRSDGLRAHPKCVVIDSDGEVHGRGARAGRGSRAGVKAANRMRRACLRRQQLSLGMHSFLTPYTPPASVRVAVRGGCIRAEPGRSGRWVGATG